MNEGIKAASAIHAWWTAEPVEHKATPGSPAGRSVDRTQPAITHLDPMSGVIDDWINADNRVVSRTRSSRSADLGGDGGVSMTAVLTFRAGAMF